MCKRNSWCDHSRYIFENVMIQINENFNLWIDNLKKRWSRIPLMSRKSNSKVLFGIHSNHCVIIISGKKVIAELIKFNFISKFFKCWP